MHTQLRESSSEEVAFALGLEVAWEFCRLETGFGLVNCPIVDNLLLESYLESLLLLV
jgi:hypothetical protein